MSEQIIHVTLFHEEIWFLVQILFFWLFWDIDCICGSLVANSKHTAKANLLHYPIWIFSFPPFKGASYKLDEIRKQYLENQYVKELPRKNTEFFSHMVNHTEQQSAPDPQRQHLEHICYAGFCIWLIQKLQGKITKVPKSKMKVK